MGRRVLLHKNPGVPIRMLGAWSLALAEYLTPGAGDVELDVRGVGRLVARLTGAYNDRVVVTLAFKRPLPRWVRR